METVDLNIDRLYHLLSLFRVTKDEFMQKLNEKRKKQLNENDIFTKNIKVSLLKKIDVIFNKGLDYYIDPQEPLQSKDESIFFRKDDFNAKLTLGAKQIVNRFEEEKIAFNALSKLVDYTTRRMIKIYDIKEDPATVAAEVRDFLYPEFSSDIKTFLKNLIIKLSDFNILVFEFVETHNKKEKANINGFFLSPNVIVLKRNQKALRREVFTLAHELGHYLLNKEEIDGNISNETATLNKSTESDIEKWCNDFAYYFLVGQYNRDIEKLEKVNASNDYYHDIINAISYKTHLSTLALYTKLMIDGSIAIKDYLKISDDIMRSIKAAELAKAEEFARNKQKAEDEGRKLIMSSPKPIISPLYLQTLQGALFNGFITEQDFCKKLHIPADKLESYLV